MSLILHPKIGMYHTKILIKTFVSFFQRFCYETTKIKKVSYVKVSKLNLQLFLAKVKQKTKKLQEKLLI